MILKRGCHKFWHVRRTWKQKTMRVFPDWQLILCGVFGCSRAGHSGISPATLQKTKEDKDRLQPIATVEAGACLREEPLCGRSREETAGAVLVPHRNAGEKNSAPSKSSFHPVYTRKAHLFFKPKEGSDSCASMHLPSNQRYFLHVSVLKSDYALKERAANQSFL